MWRTGDRVGRVVGSERRERWGSGRVKHFVAQGGCACCAGGGRLWMRDGRF